MNIIIGQERAAEVAEKYTVLRLDAFLLPGIDTPNQAYCVVENVPITDVNKLEELQELHENLMINYGKKNWNFCEQAIEHLMGKWNGELDTFYTDLFLRLQKFKQQDPGMDWTPVINR